MKNFLNSYAYNCRQEIFLKNENYTATRAYTKIISVLE